MLLAEERLLVGLDPVRGSVVDSARQQLLVGLAGGLVGELALVGLVELSGGCFVAVGGPPVDPLLAAVGQALARPEGRRAADQLRRLDRRIGGVWSRLVDRLVDQGVLGWRRDHVVLFAVTWYPVLRSVVREELLERVRVAAVGDGEREPRAAVVLALVGLSRLLDVVAPGGPVARQAAYRHRHRADAGRPRGEEGDRPEAGRGGGRGGCRRSCLEFLSRRPAGRRASRSAGEVGAAVGDEHVPGDEVVADQQRNGGGDGCPRRPG